MNPLSDLKFGRLSDGLPLLVATVVALALGVVAARLTWTLLFPGSPTVEANRGYGAPEGSTGEADDPLPALLDLSPFGKEQAVSSVHEVTESSLAIRLRGVITGPTPLAMVEAPGGVKVLQTGEAIRGGAVIQAIEQDKIVVDNHGRLESISLPGFDKVDLDQGGGRPSVPDSPSMDALLADPEHLFDLVNVAAERRDGRVIGYRINARPGREALLPQVGLMDADILTHVAGAPLADPGNLAQMMSRLSRGGPIEVRIERAGESIQTTIDTGALQ